jgi:hypothetical protein
LLDDRAAVDVDFGASGDIPEKFVGRAAGFVGAFGGEDLGVGVANGAVAAEAVPDLRQADDVGAVGGDRLVKQGARLGDVVGLVGAWVHLHDRYAHGGILRICWVQRSVPGGRWQPDPWMAREMAGAATRWGSADD